jgi:PKD repeat protein
MKKILVLFLFVSGFVSCKKDKVDPVVAGFSFKELENGQIQFFNESSNATTYVWDFGDGSGSEEPLPTHVYNANGEYEVTLVAKGANGENIKKQQVTVTKVKNYVGMWEGTGQVTILSSGVPGETRSFTTELSKRDNLENVFNVTIKDFKNGSLIDQMDFKNCTLTMTSKQLSIFEEILTFDKRSYRKCDGLIDIIEGKLYMDFVTKIGNTNIKYELVFTRK